MIDINIAKQRPNSEFKVKPIANTYILKRVSNQFTLPSSLSRSGRAFSTFFSHTSDQHQVDSLKRRNKNTGLDAIPFLTAAVDLLGTTTLGRTK